MQIKRNPDHITTTGTKFWFKELMYWSSATGFRAIYLDKGYLRMHQGKNGLFKNNIQTIFRAWAIEEAERVMLDGPQETEKD